MLCNKGRLKKSEWSEVHSDVVEVRRIELLSEEISPQGATSVVCDQNSLSLKFTDKL